MYGGCVVLLLSLEGRGVFAVNVVSLSLWFHFKSWSTRYESYGFDLWTTKCKSVLYLYLLILFGLILFGKI